MVTLDQVRNNPAIQTYIRKADASLAALGFTEHSFAHVGIVASTTSATSSTAWTTPRAARSWPSESSTSLAWTPRSCRTL